MSIHSERLQRTSIKNSDLEEKIRLIKRSMPNLQRAVDSGLKKFNSGNDAKLLKSLFPTKVIVNGGKEAVDWHDSPFDQIVPDASHLHAAEQIIRPLREQLNKLGVSMETQSYNFQRSFEDKKDGEHRRTFQMELRTNGNIIGYLEMQVYHTHEEFGFTKTELRFHPTRFKGQETAILRNEANNKQGSRGI